MADRAEGSISIQASPKEIMAVISDFDTYPEWIGNLKSVEVLERDSKGRASRVAFKVDTRVLSASYTLDYAYRPRNAGVDWTYVEGTLRDLEGSYALERDNGDGTRVTYSISVDTGFPIPGIIKRKAEKVVIDSALKGLKQHVESTGA